MSSPLVILTAVGLAGLVILNPTALTATLALIQGIITRTLQLASGGGPHTPPGNAGPRGVSF